MGGKITWKASEKGKMLMEKEQMRCLRYSRLSLDSFSFHHPAPCWEADRHRGYLCSDFWLGLA